MSQNTDYYLKQYPTLISWKPFPNIEAFFTDRFSENTIPPSTFQLKQVHGNQVVVLKRNEPIENLRDVPGDGIVTNRPDLPIAIRTADCVPILLASGTGVIAAVHAGWRGTLAKIISKTIQVMCSEFNCHPSEIKAAIGPSICGICYEVGSEVYESFEKEWKNHPLNFFNLQNNGKFLLDLKTANHQLLVQSGLKNSHIEVRTECTRCEASRFYSYRFSQSHNLTESGRNYARIESKRDETAKFSE